MSSASKVYARIPNQDVEAFEGTQEESNPRAGSTRAWYRKPAAFSHALMTLILLILYLRERFHFQDRCWDSHNYYSPAREGLRHADYVTQRFRGSLWDESAYKGPPSPSVNTAWDDLLNAGIFAVHESELQKVHRSPGNMSTAVRFPPDVVDRGSDGRGGYMATTVGTHQLHCLHYLWQDHHQSYFPDVLEKIDAAPDLWERHYEHCVDYIRQSIMCSFDTALVTYDWVQQHQNPTPNSNTLHKCTNYNVMRAWLKSKAVEVPDGFVWEQPRGQLSLSDNP